MADKEFIESALKAHNEYRKKHSAPPLKHNKEISAIAQKWADELAAKDAFQHSQNRDYKGGKMGENIAMKWTSSGDDYTGPEPVAQWYDEVERYNYDTASGPRTGHFTQVVWINSKEVGFGKAKSSSGKWLVVANYYPAGNFIGQYKENVLKPGSAPPSKSNDSNSKGASASPSGFASSYNTPEEVATFTTDSQTRPINSKSKKTTTETSYKDGKKITKQIIEETIVGPDGKERTTRREIISTEAESEQEAKKKNEGFFAKLLSKKDQSSGDKPKPQQKLSSFIEEVVKTHNKFRKQHGCSDLKQNKEINVLAQTWADNLAKSGDLKHSNHTYKGDQLGENVATKWSSVGGDYTGQEVSDQWYKEKEKFDFADPKFTPGTGHFSQIVWKGTKEIGVGRSYTTDGRVFVVCNYYPAGNVIGRFQENVSKGK